MEYLLSELFCNIYKFYRNVLYHILLYFILFCDVLSISSLCGGLLINNDNKNYSETNNIKFIENFGI